MQLRQLPPLIRAMTFKQVVLAMVAGLRKRWVRVDMTTFGRISGRGPGKIICYGCAATNTICQIAGGDLAPHQIDILGSDAEAIPALVLRFEKAIDALRRGDIREYTTQARYSSGIPLPPAHYTPGPYLHDDYDKEDLKLWVESVKHLE